MKIEYINYDVRGKKPKKDVDNTIYKIKRLTVSVDLYESKLKENTYFCGQPFIYINSYETNDGINVTIGIGDMDDFDIYKTFENVTKEFVHEVINYAKDYEYHEFDTYQEIEDFIYLANF